MQIKNIFNSLVSAKSNLSYSFKLEWCVHMILLTCSVHVFAQNNNTLQITHPDSLFDLEEHTFQYEDGSRTIGFKDVQEIPFKPFDATSNNIQARYWYQFSATPTTTNTYLYLYFFGSDFVEVFVPEYSGYKKYTTGRLAKQQINFHRYETSTLQIQQANIDFSKPFYYNKVATTPWGKANLKHAARVLTSDQSLYTKDKLLQDYRTPRYTVFLSAFLLCFILLLTNFIISGDTNFRNYGLYLLTIVLMFSCRIPWVYNYYNNLHPNLYFIATYLGHFLGIVSYLYFIQQFVNFKAKSIHIYKLSRLTIITALLLTVFGVALAIFSPFFPHRFMIVEIFEVLFTLATLYMLIRLLALKTSVVEKVVLIGSIFLIAGNALTVVTGDNSYFLTTALIETIIFAAAISVANKIAEKLRLQAQYDLAYANKEKDHLLEMDRVKSKFFTNISHEFRTPLTLIKGPIDDSLALETLTIAQRKNLLAAQKNTNRLETLVDELLALSKLENDVLKLSITPNYLKGFLETQSEAFSFIASEKQIDYQVDLPNHPDVDWFDADALQKIIVNLLGNAFKYTPEKGSIQFTANRIAHNIVLEVRNSGSYISAEHQLHIFERFYQSHPKNPGTGIGLALTKELVELHKGTISVQSSKEKGTLFTLSIPITKEMYRASEIVHTEIPSEAAAIESSSEDVSNHFVSAAEDTPLLLIVEDNKEIQQYLTSLFEHSFQLHIASNGDEAIASAIETVPDLIVSDVMMEGTNGVEMTKHLKSLELTGHIPIILLTGKTDDIDKLQGLSAGADAYMTKPFNQKLLLATVQNLLESRRKLQDRFAQEVVLTPKEIAVSSTDELFLTRLQEVMDEQLTNPDFSATLFSSAMGVSRMQLHRKLKALTGQSTTEFLKSQRLLAAAHLIKQNKISISEVGYTVGFNDPSYFAKCFKQQFGVSPSEYSKIK